MILPDKLELIKHTDKILKEVMPLFDFSNPPVDPKELALKLVDCMRENDGYGISANQVGLPFRVFAMNADPAIVCFNPKIVDQSPEEELAMEGCLSYKGLQVKIKRFKVIKCRFTLYDGQTVTKQYQDLSARIFQHELSHLDGKTFFDDASFFHKDIGIRKWKKVQRSLKNG